MAYPFTREPFMLDSVVAGPGHFAGGLRNGLKEKSSFGWSWALASQ